MGHREPVFFSLILVLLSAGACGGRAETTRASVLSMSGARSTGAWPRAAAQSKSPSLAAAARELRVVLYPCFGLTVDRPTTNLSSSLDANLFALTAGESGPYTFPLQFAEPVPRGTVSYFTVWVDSLNVGCSDVGELAFTVVTS